MDKRLVLGYQGTRVGGGPVYVVGPFIGLNSREVYAYGITSGFYNGTLGERHTIVSPLDAYHLYVRYT